MSGVCIHEFFWPLRAADGRYYQVCRRCGVQCEYDWTTMDRVGGVPGVTLSPGVSASNPAPVPNHSLGSSCWSNWNRRIASFCETWSTCCGPRLPESPRFGRRHSGAKPFSTPAFPGTGLRKHWWASWLWSPWCCSCPRCGLRKTSRGGAACSKIPISRTTSRTDRFRRYAAARRGSVRYPGKPAESARRGSIHVAPERAQAAVKAPDLKLKGPGRPNIVASNVVPPVMPLAAAGTPSRLAPTPGLTSIVAPPPEVSQATSRRLGLLQASGVAPAPEPGMVSSKRLVTVPGTAVVAPPPLVQALVRSVGDINIGATAVVAPAPRLPVGEQHPISGALQSTTGEPGRMGCAASAFGSAFRNTFGWARGIVVRCRIQCRAASAVGSECRWLGCGWTP